VHAECPGHRLHTNADRRFTDAVWSRRGRTLYNAMFSEDGLLLRSATANRSPSGRNLVGMGAAEHLDRIERAVKRGDENGVEKAITDAVAAGIPDEAIKDVLEQSGWFRDESLRNES
jgi:hypothetical protein